MNKFIIGIIIFVLSIAILSKCSFYNQQEVTCKVTSKESVTKNNGNHQYRVYTSCGTYTIKDDLYIMRFDSADVYGSIQPNTTYTFNVGGFRIGLFSIFPNILQFRTEN